ncbi:MAG: hypothetical protein KJO54_04995 [Gammaproteobacteria bacterium]|nr:hypothetical protein [Gammaproteobacteria bacterium]NNM21185.1 hypothetical protein [Gammaproteobacteria bacterium]
MRVRTVIAVLAALAAGSATQAVERQSPGLVVVDDPPGATRFYDHMYADLSVVLDQVQGHGRLDHYVWFDREGKQRQTYRAVVTVRIPSDVPGFETLEDAMDADVRIRLAARTDVDFPTVEPSPTAYMPYAECMLAMQPVTTRDFVTYELLITGFGNDLKVAKGVCDVNMLTTNIQVGIPQMGYLDLITSLVRNDADTNLAFMEGYCY